MSELLSLLNELKPSFRTLSPQERKEVRLQLIKAAADAGDDLGLAVIDYTWWLWARDDQLLPQGDYTRIFTKCGRSWGKTRFGSEATIEHAQDNPGTQIALCGRTLGDVKRIMIYSPKSGLLVRSPPWFPCSFHRTDNVLTWINGTQALLFSSEKPEAARGPEFSFAWLDEICAWIYQRETYDNLMMGLRMGAHPIALITSTPKRQPIVKELMNDPDTITIEGSTYDNEENIPKSFIRDLKSKYEGTTLGDQELRGLYLEHVTGALWRIDQIEALRIERRALPQIVKIAIGVDPAVSTNRKSDLTGIVAVGLGIDGHLYLLDDASGRYTPNQWAEAVFEVVKRWKPLCPVIKVVLERNRGGDLVTSNLANYATAKNLVMPDLHEFNSQEGKCPRAEPVAALTEQGRVHHCGNFAELEDQLTTWEAFQLEERSKAQKSPNNLDAYVFACAELTPYMPTWEAPAAVIEPPPLEIKLAQRTQERSASRSPVAPAEKRRLSSRWR